MPGALVLGFSSVATASTDVVWFYGLRGPGPQKLAKILKARPELDSAIFSFKKEI
jgi:hypothetical protein